MKINGAIIENGWRQLKAFKNLNLSDNYHTH